MARTFLLWLSGVLIATSFCAATAHADVQIQLQRQSDSRVLVSMSGSIDVGSDAGFAFEPGSKIGLFLNGIFGVAPVSTFVSVGMMPCGLTVGGACINRAQGYGKDFGPFGPSIMFSQGWTASPDLPIAVPFAGSTALSLGGAPETFAAVGSSGDITWGVAAYSAQSGLDRGVKVGTWTMVSSVPEPSQALLLMAGLVGFLGWTRRQRRSA